MPFPNHYSTLNIESNASDEEIKQAFRRLAKKFHPDKNPGSEKTSERRFKQINAAYEILRNRESRNMYDLTLNARLASKQESPIDNLRRKAEEDLSCRCRLILFELLNHNTQDALRIYEDLISEMPDFRMDKYMSDADTRDCEFLLAEAYDQRSKFSKAARLYEKVLEREAKRAYFRQFAMEIRLMLKDVYLKRMANSKSSEEILADMRKILRMDLPKREIARVYKKAAEAYYRTNDIDNAERTLRNAFRIDPNLTGVKKISSKLGMKSDRC